MADKPLWREAFDTVDRRIAGPAEAAARSDVLHDALTIAWRLRRRTQRELEKRTRHALHLINVPAATDVRRLYEQVAALRRELRELEERQRVIPARLERVALRGRNALRYVAGTSGPQIGGTPKDVVWRRHKAELWRYRNEDVRHHPPVVIVHSLVSRSYVLDLYPGNSAVEFLLGEGFDVFLLDWGVADEAEAGNTLETYSEDYLPEAIAAACEAAESDDVTLLGYCFGGVLTLLAAARRPELPIRNLVLMATPVDFTGIEAITALVRNGRLEPDELVDASGNVPANSIENMFRLLKPTAEYSQYANLWQHLWNDQYMEGYQAMGQWTRDHVPFPGAAFRETVEQLVRENGLMDGRVADLSAIGMPVLNVMAERDHIVPLAAAEPVAELIPQTDELRLKAGHVGLVAGRSAAKVTLPGIAGWIADHSNG